MESLTTREVAVLLGKSERAVSRYVKKGLLTAHKVKNEEGRIENRFDPKEVQNLKDQKQTQDTMTDTRQDTGQGVRQELSVIDVLQDRIKEQSEQLKMKDAQIEKILSKVSDPHETNVLLGQAQATQDKEQEKLPLSTQDTIIDDTTDSTTDMSYDDETDTQDDMTDAGQGVSEVQNKRKWYFLWLFR